MEREAGAETPFMVSLIEPILLGHIESLMEMELRLLHELADSGGCQYRPDNGVVCFFLSPLTAE